MKAIVTIIPTLLLVSAGVHAQKPNGAGMPDVGTAPHRTEFISYDIRENAEKDAKAKNQHYLELKPVVSASESGVRYRMQVDVPLLWLDREIFLYVEGVPGFRLSVGDRVAGYAGGGRTPSEFNLSNFLIDGPNTITIEAADRDEAGLDAPGSREPLVYIHSQPKLRVEDFRITATPDSLNKYGILEVRLIVSNSYNFAESFTVGYDIYAPGGKLQCFDMREVVVPGMGRDTVVFNEFIYGTPHNLWEAGNPALYYGMITVKHGSRMTEYIPYKTGFGTTSVSDGQILRNGKAITVKAVRYNSAPDRKTTADDLAKLKKAGMNTVCVDYPQPLWFYELCDATGLYVIDQADIHSGADPSDRSVGGSPANDPSLLPVFLDRTEAMFRRTVNHPCIIGWSLGGIGGNGYNFYKTYRWLKANEPARAVVFDGAEGEWNSDMDAIRPVDAGEILNAAPATPAATRGRR